MERKLTGTPVLKQDRVARYDAIYAGADEAVRDRLDCMVINIQSFMRKRHRRMQFGIGMAKELIISMVDQLPPRGEGWAWETLLEIKSAEMSTTKSGEA
jgi:hypothetical protein